MMSGGDGPIAPVPNGFRPDHRPRILVLHPSDELYGADRVLLEVLEAIADEVKPIVVLPLDTPSGPLSLALRRQGIIVERIAFPVLRRRYQSPIGVVRLAFAASIGSVRLYRCARQHRVRVIHANTSAILFAPFLAALVRVPWLWHLHEIVERPRWLCQAIGWISSRRQGQVLAVSRAVAQHLEQCGGRESTVIFNPAPPSQPDPILPERPNTVLMVGRVNGSKGHREFALAARLLHESGLNAEFRLLGGPVPGREEPYETLGREVRELDPDGTWLAFAGHSSNVGEEMSRAGVVVVPSVVAEGLNITALEAMALGRPVIASAVGGLPEVVADEETGLLVPPGDVDALARAVRRIIEDPILARRLGEAGRERAVTVFGREAFQASWRQIYRRVLGEDVTS